MNIIKPDSPHFKRQELIRQDTERKEAQAWTALRQELMPGMKADRSTFIEVSAAEVIKRNKQTAHPQSDHH